MSIQEPERTILPKSIPRWIRDKVRNLESERFRLMGDKERIMKQLGNTQVDFQDLLDLVQRIADEREPSVCRACREMMERFNPGSYTDRLE